MTFKNLYGDLHQSGLSTTIITIISQHVPMKEYSQVCLISNTYYDFLLTLFMRIIKACCILISQYISQLLQTVDAFEAFKYN